MNVFISWSGDRSKAVALALNNWIPKVIQSANPWMSAEDISTGSRWGGELNSQLENTAVGIICITPENQQSPWLHFEAGCLSKSLAESKVMPLLLDMPPGQLSGPMSQFQAVQSTKVGLKKIVESINESLGGLRLKEIDLDEIFDVWWPKLTSQLESIQPYNDVIPKRESGEMLEEVLNLLRDQRRRHDENLEKLESRKNDMQEMFDKMHILGAAMDEKSKQDALLEKQKLSFLASSVPSNGAEGGVPLPQDLAELIDKQSSDNPMKDFVGFMSNMQQSFMKSLPEKEQDSDKEA